MICGTHTGTLELALLRSIRGLQAQQLSSLVLALGQAKVSGVDVRTDKKKKMWVKEKYERAKVSGVDVGQAKVSGVDVRTIE